MPWVALKDTCPPQSRNEVSSTPPPILPRQIRVHPASLTRNIFLPMPETTYPWDLFSGFRSNTYPLLGSLMEQACGNERREEAHSNPVLRARQDRALGSRLPDTDPLRRSGPGRAHVSFGATSEAPRGQQLSGAILP